MADPGAEAELLERGEALDQLAESVASVLGGRGAFTLVEALPGLGKTALLAEAARTAAAGGVRVLSARGAPLESGYAFGIVRQLLEPAVRGAPDSVFAGEARFAERVFTTAADGPGPDRYSVLQALHRLTTRLCETRPTLLVVDDAHWADGPSLQYLAFLQHRLLDRALGIVVATRPVQVDAPHAFFELVGAAERHLRLEPLSPAATRALLRSLLPGASDDVADSAHTATGGNPFYLRQLALSAPSGGLHEPPEAVQAVVARRVTTLGEEAIALARAVYVLGRAARPRMVARLTGADPTRTRHVLAGLVAGGVLVDDAVLDFVHPLVRDAVGAALVGSLGPELGLAAARLLVEEGRDVESAAALLLPAEPAGEAWVVPTLRAAARRTAARGAPAAALPYLRRALAEPAADGASDLLLELGLCEQLAGDPAAVEHLREALDRAQDDAQIAAAGLALGRALGQVGEFRRALRALRAARERLAEPASDDAVRLDMEAVTLGRLDLSTIAEVDAVLQRYAPPPGDRPVDKLVLANLCLEPVRGMGSAAEAVALARRAVEGGALFQDQAADSHVLTYPVVALSLSDAPDDARAVLDELTALAERQGSVLGHASALCWTSQVALRAGDLDQAEEAAWSAMERMQACGSAVLMPYAVAFLSDALVEKGEVAQAAGLWPAADLDGELPPVLPSNYLLFSRGALRLAQGRAADAAADLAESGRRQAASGVHNPAFWPWQSSLALALHQLGRLQEARRLVADELAAARAFGAPRATGIALRVSGLVASGPEGEALLQEAVDVLAASPAALELARAQVDLGALRRRSGSRSRARADLTRGLDAALACGAAPLAARARAELEIAGARPGRATTGPAALTASERRVAELAAAGRTNREIAAALFVSGKTVETHMRAVLRKLGLDSRRRLAEQPELRPGTLPG